jgi:hypothetical protein
MTEFLNLVAIGMLWSAIAAFFVVLILKWLGILK